MGRRPRTVPKTHVKEGGWKWARTLDAVGLLNDQSLTLLTKGSSGMLAKCLDLRGDTAPWSHCLNTPEGGTSRPSPPETSDIFPRAPSLFHPETRTPLIDPKVLEEPEPEAKAAKPIPVQTTPVATFTPKERDVQRFREVPQTLSGPLCLSQDLKVDADFEYDRQGAQRSEC